MEEKELSTTISTSPVNSEFDAAVTQPPNNQQNDIDNNNNSVVSPNNNNMSMVGIVTSEGGLSFGSTTTAIKEKKKRGRPRKYDADGNLRVSYASPQTTPFSLSSASSDQFSQSSVVKRGRGRPSGSGNWQLLASLGEMFASTAGGDFTPHVVTVSTGEDVASKILSFAEKGPRGICVLSANGAVSNVTIRQPGSSGGILTYEGRFEILSLSGSFTVTEISGGKSRTGGLSVSLAGPDGRVIGGGLAGLLTAASPIQIVVGSFIPNGYKTQKRKYNRSENNVASPQLVTSETVTFANPISQAKPALEATLVPNPNRTPPPPITTTFLLPPMQPNVADQKPMISSTTMSSGVKESPNNFAVWNGPPEMVRPTGLHRSPDINVSVPGDL